MRNAYESQVEYWKTKLENFLAMLTDSQLIAICNQDKKELWKPRSTFLNYVSEVRILRNEELICRICYR
jgi:hypothetical protein